MGQQVVFAYEAQERLRVAFLGTSGHAFRNYLPVLPFLPVEYVAHWDPDRAKAQAFARQFGAGTAGYDDVGELLRQHPRHHVDAATGRDRHDDMHRPFGIFRARHGGRAEHDRGDRRNGK